MIKSAIKWHCLCEKGFDYRRNRVFGVAEKNPTEPVGTFRKKIKTQNTSVSSDYETRPT